MKTTTLSLAALVAVPLLLGGCTQSGSGGLFGSTGGLFGDSAGARAGAGTSAAEGPYAYNGRCDDPRYNTSNGGRAQAGTDEYDCSRFGGGLKR